MKFLFEDLDVYKRAAPPISCSIQGTLCLDKWSRS